MEKILTIDGRQVRFKSTAALPLRYKAQFGRDLVSDFSAVQKSWHPTPTEDGAEDGADGGYFDDTADFELIYNVLWAMAKTADPSIKPPLEWFDEFDGLPVFNWFAELGDLITASFAGTQKN